jgi:hypothetical protein
MTFLAPAMLFGAALAAGPVVIHLLNRRRHRTIPWAAMEFLTAIDAHSSRRLKVEEWLLVALRTLVILLLALAASRPVIGTAPGGAIILIDRSASMRAVERGRTRFDAARETAEAVARALPAGAPAALVAFDNDAEALTGGAANGETVTETLKALAPGWCGTDYRAALDAAADMGEGFASPPAVIIVSDFHEGARGLDGGAAQGSGTGVFLLAAGGGPVANRAVVGVERAGAAFTAEATELSVTVLNTGTASASLPVSLRVDGAESGKVDVNVPAGQVASVSASVEKLAAAGTHLVETGIPADDYTADDLAFAVIETRPVRVAIISAGDATRFLDAAIGAAPAGTLEAVRFDGASPPDIDAFLVAGAFPSGDAAAEIWRRVRVGGFAVVFLDAASAGQAAAFLAASKDARIEGLAAVRAATGTFSLALSGEHRITRFIAQTQALSLSAVPVAKALGIPVPESGAVVPIVVESAAGRHAFLELLDVGAGRVAIWNSAADRSTGDLPVTPFFVPLLFETIAWGSWSYSGRAGFFCGEGVVTPVLGGTSSGEPEAVLVPGEPGFHRADGRDIAVNVPREESRLTAADRARVARALGGRFTDAAGIAAALGGEAGREISVWLLAAALLLLAVEMAAVGWLRGRA